MNYKDTVKYHNDMNDISFGLFSAREMDLFMTICSVMKEKGIDSVNFDFMELKRISGITTTDNQEFEKILNETYDNLLKVHIRIGNDRRYTRFNLFSDYTVDNDETNISISINEKFSYILNDLTSNFTMFELKELVGLRSKYSKACYRKLKQYKDTGYWIVKIDDFKRLLDIPTSYRFGNIDQKVLNPIMEELPEYFPNLRIDKIKSRKKGTPITHLEFHFNRVKSLKDREIIEQDSIWNDKNLVELAKQRLNGIDIDIQQYISLQIEYSLEHTPRDLKSYVREAIKEDYAKAIEKLGTQISIDDLSTRKNTRKRKPVPNIKGARTERYTEEQLNQKVIDKWKGYVKILEEEK